MITGTGTGIDTGTDAGDVICTADDGIPVGAVVEAEEVAVTEAA